jgi:poly-beta-1,6-N-acetyl-D-glucosamine synthase
MVPGVWIIGGVFWAALALLAYTFVGYPLLIAARARFAPRPVRRVALKAADAPAVAVVVVAYNEAQRIEAKIATLRAQDYPRDRLRIVIATDGSTDGTPEIVARAARHDVGITLLAMPTRRGKAACLNDAVAACSEAIIVFNDARQMLNREAVRSLVENFADNSVGAVSGELVFSLDGATAFGGGVDAYWRYETFIRRNEALAHSVPGATGALYALRRSAFKPIPTGTILDDVAIPMHAALAGLRVVFEGRAQAFDKPADSPQQERLRKVRTLAGNYQLIAQMPALLSPRRNPIWLAFVSHKLLRLIAPFAMMAMFAASAVLALQSPAHAAFFVAQTLFYTAALAVPRWPALGRLKLARIASAFVMLNWFAVLGLMQFALRREGHLWTTTAPTAAAAAAAATPRRD